MKLIEHQPCRVINLPESDIIYLPQFITAEQADYFLNKFRTETPWQQKDIMVFGKVYPQPRLTAFYATNLQPYSYSNITMEPLPFTEDLLSIKQQLRTITSVDFTSCLLNRYRDGKDSNGWHADDEKELGTKPVIASVSFGQERYFHLRQKKDKTKKYKFLLEHGSLLLMQGNTQHHWQHQIPKTRKVISDRINLTFRIIQ